MEMLGLVGTVGGIGGYFNDLADLEVGGVDAGIKRLNEGGCGIELACQEGESVSALNCV